MRKNKGVGPPPHGLLTIGYGELGTVALNELRDAIIEDIQALKDIYNIRYVRNPTLKILATNEYGEPVKIRRPAGGTISYMDTHHFRPACKDYDL